MDSNISNASDAELSVLRKFFDTVFSTQPHDNSISESKLMRDTRNQLKLSLKGATERCSCAKRYYGPCEVCQASSNEIVKLRNFYRVIRNAKKHSMTEADIQKFIENHKNNK